MTEPPITAPTNAWCSQHWRAVVSDLTANAAWCVIRVVTRTLEMDRFTAQFARDSDGRVVFDVNAINLALAAAAPLCCYLGDDEMRLIRAEARGFGQRRS